MRTLKEYYEIFGPTGTIVFNLQNRGFSCENKNEGEILAGMYDILGMARNKKSKAIAAAIALQNH